MINVVIIEDEEHCLATLKNMLQQYSDVINVSGVAGTVKSAISVIDLERPDFVFLDVYLPDGTGFDVIEGVCNLDFKVVFTTAYDEFAIKAIKYSALDYLLKPVDPDELEKTIYKIEHKIAREYQHEKVENLLAGVKKKTNRLVVHTQEGIELVDMEKIVWLQAESSYTKVYMLDTSMTLFSKNLRYFEDLLEEEVFYRVHHSAIINMRYIRKYLKEDGGMALMEGGDKVPIASRRKAEFINKLTQHYKK